jgi:cytochrome c oxidase subunit I
MSDSHSHAAEAHAHPQLGFFRKYIFSEDHKIIGIQFLISSIIFLFVGGLLALLVRTQLGWPHAEIPIIGQWLWPGSAGGHMPPDFYNMAFTMHASVMIFLVIIPALTGGFGNFTIPLMIGAPDMAFPKLNMMSYWFMWPAFIVMCLSFFLAPGGAAASGWTSYPSIASVTMPAGQGFESPAQAASGWGQIMWLTGLIFIGISSMMGSVNYITTIIQMRAPGMTLLRMPMSTWSMFITAILQAFALPVLTVALILQLLDKTFNTSFFLPPGFLTFGNWQAGPGGGQVLLWQHLFWFYSHPAVYIMILPAMGMVSDIVSTFSRKPLFGYKPMVFAIAGIAGLGFIVWGHHMFQSGMDPRLGTGFMIATVMIALPSAVKVFNWLGTTYQGNLQLNTAMLNALAFVSMFVIGGLSGIFMAATTVDVYIHDTYFIVGHIHYVLFMSSVFGIFAGIYYWYPKMFGRLMSEKWGKVHFFLTFIAANCTFYPMHIIGVGGHMRRIADPLAYTFIQPLQPLNTFMSISAFVLGFSQFIFVANFFGSLIWGQRSGRNPWKSNTLEWAAPSPPGHGNFDVQPVVYRGPYEYAAPEQVDDYWPQSLPPGETKVPENFPLTQPAEAPKSDEAKVEDKHG